MRARPEVQHVCAVCDIGRSRLLAERHPGRAMKELPPQHLAMRSMRGDSARLQAQAGPRRQMMNELAASPEAKQVGRTW